MERKRDVAEDEVGKRLKEGGHDWDREGVARRGHAIPIEGSEVR